MNFELPINFPSVVKGRVKLVLSHLAYARKDALHCWFGDNKIMTQSVVILKQITSKDIIFNKL